MPDLNRIEVVLVEQKRQVNGWQNDWERILQLCLNGVLIHRNPIFMH